MIRTLAGGGPARSTSNPAVSPSRAAPWLDVLGVVLLWAAFAAWVGRGRLVFAYDVFRDMAYAHGVSRGRLWSDPTLPGLPAWYPPGNPLLMAAAAYVTPFSLTGLYGTSLYWLQWALPVLLHGLVRACWGRAAAWLSLAFVLLGSLWWLTHAAMPMPSVQGIGFTLAALLAWIRARRAGWRWTVATGTLGGLALWTHLLDGAFAVGCVFVHGIVGLVAPGEEPAEVRRELALRGTAAALLAAALAAPVLARQLWIPRVNDAPHHWFAPELHDPLFALQAHAPLVPLLGILGLALAAREWHRQGWLVAWFSLGTIGQLIGYAAHDRGWKIPWAIPHEFQWHEQLALCVAAATTVPWIATRLSSTGAARPVRPLAVALLVGVSLSPALPRLPRAASYVTRAGEDWRGTFDLARWISLHTDPDAVLIAHAGASYFLAGLTGRAMVVLPAGHMNPAIDPRPRQADVYTMLTTGDERTFASLAERYRADYLLVRQEPRVADQARQQQRYARWRILEPVRVSHAAMWVYRIHRDEARTLLDEVPGRAG
jgi:hypothetical protein